MKNNLQWFLPHKLAPGVKEMLTGDMLTILPMCGYYQKDLAKVIGIAPSTFTGRFSSPFTPIDVVTRRKLIELVGEENFLEAMGRMQSGTKRKYMFSYELRTIMKQCHISLGKLGERSGLSQSTISQNYSEYGKNDVALRIIDNLSEIIGKEDFALAVLTLRGPIDTWPVQQWSWSQSREAENTKNAENEKNTSSRPVQTRRKAAPAPKIKSGHTFKLGKVKK